MSEIPQSNKRKDIRALSSAAYAGLQQHRNQLLYQEIFPVSAVDNPQAKMYNLLYISYF